jgi:hypothetical protein
MTDVLVDKVSAGSAGNVRTAYCFKHGTTHVITVNHIAGTGIQMGTVNSIVEHVHRVAESGAQYF